LTQRIRKAAAVIIQDHQLLVTRTTGHDIFIAPGGKMKAKESSLDCLKRELNEELQITIQESDISFLATFSAPAALNPSQTVIIENYLIKQYQGQLTPSAEIAEIRWITSSDLLNIKLGSIFRDHIIPLLMKESMID
jgi:ADP-ribose pyrophosphatase YjhB (NUDIX family)